MEGNQGSHPLASWVGLPGSFKLMHAVVKTRKTTLPWSQVCMVFGVLCTCDSWDLRIPYQDSPRLGWVCFHHLGFSITQMSHMGPPAKIACPLIISSLSHNVPLPWIDKIYYLSLTTHSSIMVFFSLFCFKSLFYFYFMYTCIHYMYVSAPSVYLVPMKVKRQHWIPWN